MTAAVLAHLAALDHAHDAATPGRWEVDGEYPGEVYNGRSGDEERLVVDCQDHADAAAIVAEHNAFGPLLQAVREFAELEASYPLGSDVPVYRLGRIVARLEAALGVDPGAGAR
ncbi:hypothetical protein [Blastococcus mobilis]|uniref:Uncharacterized protein n=1 Tax=Blastococcus mobilis TaxID=1938746 RepID=A0A238VEL6_9ACTN|nr:hypothetical protein [Blastococcus mobilis]SNR32850.1 hypothetical protein SAMN06272737_10360 [Blastococcus mobilis]